MHRTLAPSIIRAYAWGIGADLAWHRPNRVCRSRKNRVTYWSCDFVNAAGRQPEEAALDGLDAHWSRLMVLAQNGDRRAYAELLRDISPVLRAVARRQHNHFDRAEDVVQDTLLTIHRVRHTYDPSRSFRGWIYAIVRRRSIDLLRKRGRIAVHEESVAPEVVERVAEPPAVENVYSDIEPALARAVAALPPGQRQAIELVKLREFTLSEASAHSGMSVGALKVAVHRAMKTLRDHLASP